MLDVLVSNLEIKLVLKRARGMRRRNVVKAKRAENLSQILAQLAHSGSRFHHIGNTAGWEFFQQRLIPVNNQPRNSLEIPPILGGVRATE